MYTRREALPTVTTATIPQAALDEVPFDERFEALLEEGRVLLDAERFEDALRCYEEAEVAAGRLGRCSAEERAFVSRCAVLIATERGLAAEPFRRLREILMAGDDAVNCRLAAYNIARAYEFAKEHRKGLFYARIALDRSRLLESIDWLASSHNQIGNFLLAESRFEQACEEYQEALSLLPAGQVSVRRAAIFDNLGYTYVVLGRVPQGLALLYRSLRELRSMGQRRETILPHLSLCFALLEIGRSRHALKHAAVALALAEEAGEKDSIKHALFLLGEAAQQAGDPAQALSVFERLQERYFPGASYLPEVLLTVDVRNLINLKA
jgi:tetratricopeptide (TPR) repeat protein